MTNSDGDESSSQILLKLYFEKVDDCEICGRYVSLYKWPSEVKLTDSSIGCLRCLHMWLDWNKYASNIVPFQFHNGRPILELLADLGPRRRGRFDCARCQKVLYGVQRFSAHWRHNHKNDTT